MAWKKGLVLLALLICSLQSLSMADNKSTWTDAEPKIYVMKLNSSNGSLILDGINVEAGSSYEKDSIERDPRYYECRVFSFSGRLLKRFDFMYPNVIYWDSVDPATGELYGGMDTDNTVTLYIKYFPDAKAINFYGPQGNLALSVDVSEFSDKGQMNDRPPRNLTGFWRNGNETYYIKQTGNVVQWYYVITNPDGTSNDNGLLMEANGTLLNYTIELLDAVWPPESKEDARVILDVVSEDKIIFTEGGIDNYRGSYIREESGK